MVFVTKSNLRMMAAAHRDSITPGEYNTRCAAITERLFSFAPFTTAKSPFLFVSFRSEPVTHFIIRRMLEEGRRVLVPKVDKAAGEMIASELHDFDADLVSGMFNILEPRAEALRPVTVEEIDFVLAPGLAFDRRGYRLGYGGGFYDKLLARIRPETHVSALAFSFQIYDEIPTDENDKKINSVITDEETIVFG